MQEPSSVLSDQVSDSRLEMDYDVELSRDLFRLQGDLLFPGCLLYTSDAADELLCVDLGGRRIINKHTPHYFPTIYPFHT